MTEIGCEAEMIVYIADSLGLNQALWRLREEASGWEGKSAVRFSVWWSLEVSMTCGK